MIIKIIYFHYIIWILLFDEGLEPKYPEYNNIFFDHSDISYKIGGKGHDFSLLIFIHNVPRTGTWLFEVLWVSTLSWEKWNSYN